MSSTHRAPFPAAALALLALLLLAPAATSQRHLATCEQQSSCAACTDLCSMYPRQNPAPAPNPPTNSP